MPTQVNPVAVKQQPSGYGSQWKWGSGYGSSFARKSQYCDSRIKKKEYILQQVNFQALKQLNPELIEVDIRLAEPPQEFDGPESELDEMWSYVGKKDNPRWLWHAIQYFSVKAKTE